MNKTFVLFFLLIFLVISGCGIFRGGKKITKIEFSYPNDAPISYGQRFELDVVAVYSNGRTRKITHKKELSISISGAYYEKGEVIIPGYPENFLSDTILVEAEYVDDEKTYTTQKKIPFNYNSLLMIDRSGKDGANGSGGKDRGTPLIFRNGNDGNDGLDGVDGENGHDLTVNIWKDSSSRKYKIKVHDLVDDKVFYYNFIPKNNGITFKSVGGRGGKGGDGGEGGKGKDGVNSGDKRKSPGDAGNGGNGGNGGSGGNGGAVYIFVHPNASDIISYLDVMNHGGPGGQPGKAGEAGEPGTPATGQEAAKNGDEGTAGEMGAMGNNGLPHQITIEDFDFK